MAVLIRRVKVSDAAAMARHMSDPAVVGGTLQLPYPSEEAWHMRLTEGLTAPVGNLQLVAERDGDVVGAAGVMAACPQVRRRHVMMLGITVSPQAQGQGVGTALMRALCDHADRWVGALRIELSVFTDNEVAVRLYRNFGFEIEGTCRAYAFRDGAFVDAHMMARLHPDPPWIGTRRGSEADAV